MTPISCTNCCHNPLQVGSVGYQIGRCTRLQVTLLAPGQSTCGNLQRKDLRRERAESERVLHAQSFGSDFVSDLFTAKRSTLVAETQHALERGDAVLAEVYSYGVVSKIASLATLRRMAGVRAEIALTSLGRGYFANCLRRGGQWTAGIHLAWWVLSSLTRRPELELHDFRTESTLSIDHRANLAQWYVLAARLLLLLDVSSAAQGQAKSNGMPRLTSLVTESFVLVPAGDGDKLLRHLSQRRKRYADAFPEKHYQKLAAELHRSAPTEDEDEGPKVRVGGLSKPEGAS